MENIMILAIWNAFVFITYGVDKYNSMNGKRRISEANLLSMAFFFGGFGAFLGMLVLRHKTKHLNFIILVPLAILFNLAVIYLFRRLHL